MNRDELVGLRLYSHGLGVHRTATPASAVARMGAIQAQLTAGGKWSVGLRSACTRQAVDDAIAVGTVVRTWMMRGTLHFVPSADARWMLDLLTPPIIAASASRVCQLGLDDGQFTRAEAALGRELRQSGLLTRKQALDMLRCDGLSTEGQRGYALLSHAAQWGLIVFGPQQGTQETFVLLDSVALPGKAWRREEALAELALRYFTSHGPATAEDFARWSGLKLTDTRVALRSLGDALQSDEYEGATVYFAPDAGQTQKPAGALLLSGFDEYVLGYRDRSAVLDRGRENDIVPGGNGMFRNTIVLDGRVAGTWCASARRGMLTVTMTPFEKLTADQAAALDRPVRAYGDFLGLKTCWDLDTAASSACDVDGGILRE